MDLYQTFYEAQTGQITPPEAGQLAPLFDRLAAGQVLPPRGQQAVEAGLTAHELNDPQSNPPLYRYYQWILTHYFQPEQVQEMSAKLIGMAFVCANLFATDLPQPLSLNPWQLPALLTFPLCQQKAVIIENNGVFVWLHAHHPTWPLIDQQGNDFNATYLRLMRNLEARGVQFAYLGDLDQAGIRMADHLFGELQQTPIATFLALQSVNNVARWLALYGKTDPRRSRDCPIKQPLLRQQLDSIHLFGKFVEQEQLLGEYETLIQSWLDRKT
ncbi:DUF2399 domain-containing protein [Lapidilactobacillus luobeiensis]|uniref:DUF2399 domain-containing protein n=1 Tax=Lapidilactobacillus luobeiensis TaxID=2950371 RepID=UPI0021C31D9B|nr:DUF2399 domain-containing protein [Lapidilactobacillus luobeiensis]